MQCALVRPLLPKTITLAPLSVPPHLKKNKNRPDGPCAHQPQTRCHGNGTNGDGGEWVDASPVWLCVWLCVHLSMVYATVCAVCVHVNISRVYVTMCVHVYSVTVCVRLHVNLSMVYASACV